MNSIVPSQTQNRQSDRCNIKNISKAVSVAALGLFLVSCGNSGSSVGGGNDMNGGGGNDMNGGGNDMDVGGGNDMDVGGGNDMNYAPDTLDGITLIDFFRRDDNVDGVLEGVFTTPNTLSFDMGMVTFFCCLDGPLDSMINRPRTAAYTYSRNNNTGIFKLIHGVMSSIAVEATLTFATPTDGGWAATDDFDGLDRTSSGTFRINGN